jgi:hypothetical protein
MLAIGLWILLWVTLCHSSSLPSTHRAGETDVVQIDPRDVHQAHAGYFGPDNSHRTGYLRIPVSRSVINVTSAAGRHRKGRHPVRPRPKRQEPGWGWEHLEDLLSGISYAIDRPICPYYPIVVGES